MQGLSVTCIDCTDHQRKIGSSLRGQQCVNILFCKKIIHRPVTTYKFEQLLARYSSSQHCSQINLNLQFSLAHFCWRKVAFWRLSLDSLEVPSTASRLFIWVVQLNLRVASLKRFRLILLIIIKIAPKWMDLGGPISSTMAGRNTEWISLSLL